MSKFPSAGIFLFCYYTSMYTLRTRFKKEIVAEFLPPARPTKKQRVIIFADGAPSVPNKKSLLEFFSKKGFWGIHIHYRGSWESDGKFLAKAPHLDILDVVESLPKGFTDLWNNKVYKVNPDQVIVIGSSFGGAAGILASQHENIHKVIAISPMIDWQNPGPDEPYPKIITFFEEAFGNGYRFVKNGWTKLQSGTFFNPIHEVDKIRGDKLLIIHAKDDQTCPYPITKAFALTTGAKLITLVHGDHLGSSTILKPRFYKLFTSFIKK